MFLEKTERGGRGGKEMGERLIWRFRQGIIAEIQSKFAVP